MLRRDEDVADVVRYILDNPARAGLAESSDDYPYARSAFGLTEPA